MHSNLLNIYTSLKFNIFSLVTRIKLWTESIHKGTSNARREILSDQGEDSEMRRNKFTSMLSRRT